MLELLWLDPKCVSRIRKNPPWRAILDAVSGLLAREAPALPNQTVSVEDRRDVFLLLANGAPAERDVIPGLVSGAIRSDGKFTPPLLLVEGEVSLLLDRLEVLKATIANAALYAAKDEALNQVVSAAREFIGLIGLTGLIAPPSSVDVFTRQIQEAFVRGKRGLPPGHLEMGTERAVLEKRSYQTQGFDGVPSIRADVHIEPPGPALATFLPASAIHALPLHQSFPARLIVEVHRMSDPHEPQSFAFKVLALSRWVPPFSGDRERRP